MNNYSVLFHIIQCSHEAARVDLIEAYFTETVNKSTYLWSYVLILAINLEYLCILQTRKCKCNYFTVNGALLNGLDMAFRHN